MSNPKSSEGTITVTLEDPTNIINFENDHVLDLFAPNAAITFNLSAQGSTVTFEVVESLYGPIRQMHHLIALLTALGFDPSDTEANVNITLKGN